MAYQLKDMNSSLKLLFTGYLIIIAVGYCVSIGQILLTNGMADGKLDLSVDDIVYSFHGNRSGSLLENKLNGSMKNRLPDKERIEIIQWIRSGAKESAFAPRIQEIFSRYCVSCHNSVASSIIPDFTLFDNIKKRSLSNHGTSFAALTRISHIHLFGIAFIFLSVGVIFTFSASLPLKLKNFIIVMPYLFLGVDVLSWWLTKLEPLFAWAVMLSGGGLVILFVLMWTVAIYEMWFMPNSIP